MYKYKTYPNILYFMKTRRNSSNKVKKQIAEIKTVIKINLKLTGNRLWPVFTETKLPIDRKSR